MGLLLDRSGGRKASLGAEMVSRLCTEAEEIGRKVRRWKPPDDLLELLDRLSEAELLVDEDAMDHLEWARYRRSDGGTPNRARAIALRFPFLTQEEISRALAKPVSKAQAMRWVRARLSSDISSSTLKNRRAKSFD